ncbi:MAG: beta-galactosidase [Verrucomicrobiota bacterium]
MKTLILKDMTQRDGHPKVSPLLAAMSVVLFQIQAVAAIPVAGPLNVPGTVASGEASATLTVADAGGPVRLEGVATKGAPHEENKILNAAVIDFRLPVSVELPADTTRLGFAYRRPQAANPVAELGLRLLIEDSRGGVWAFGSRLGLKQSRLNYPGEFTPSETYTFTTNEAGRVDSWVATSLNPERFDRYESPVPPYRLAGFRVTAYEPSGKPFSVEVDRIVALSETERPTPYWVLEPERLLSMRVDKRDPFYEGAYGWGEENPRPVLKASSLRLEPGDYRLAWEITDRAGWRSIASGRDEALQIVDAGTVIARLPLLAEDTYQLRVTSWRKRDGQRREFAMHYVVIRDREARGLNAGDAALTDARLLRIDGAGPVFAADGNAKISISAAAGVPVGARVSWSVETADLQPLDSGEGDASEALELDVSRYAKQAGTSLWLSVRLLDGKTELDAVRRLVGFETVAEKAESVVVADVPGDKLTRAMSGRLYRTKGDWSEGFTSAVTLAGKTMEQLEGWLAEGRETGYNAVELSAPWDDLNPLPGVYRFEFLDRQIAAAKRHGFYVTLRVHPHGRQVPGWVKRDYMQDENGLAHGLWSGANNLIFSPAGTEFREALPAFSEALARHYRESETVLGYCFEGLFFDHDLLDMPWLGQYVDYSEASAAEYRRTLRANYGDDLAKLNAAHGSAHAAWDAIPLPRQKIVYDEDGRIRPRTDAAWRDWIGYKIDVLKRLRIGAADAFRRGDPECWVGLYNTNSQAFYTDELVRREAWVPYGSMESPWPPALPEIRGRVEPHGKIARTRTVADVGMTNLLLAGKPGYHGVFNYWFYERRLATVTAVEREAEERLRQWFKVVDEIVGATPVKNSAAGKSGGYVFSPTAQLALLQHVFVGRTEDYLKPWLHRMDEDRVRVDEVRVYGGTTPDYARHAYVYFPFGAAAIDAVNLRAVSDYVRGGGRLVIEATSGFWLDNKPNALGGAFGLPAAKPVTARAEGETERAAWEDDSRENGFKWPALGFRTREFSPPIDTQATPWIHNIARPFLRSYRVEGALPEGAVVLARYDDGTPAVVSMSVGKGEVLAFYGTVDWIGSAGLAAAVDAWGRGETRVHAKAGADADEADALILRTFEKADRRFVVGRRYVGHDVLERLKNTQTGAQDTDARPLTVRFAADSLGAMRYRLRDLLNERDLGSFDGAALMQDGVEVALAPGEAVYWEARPVDSK